MNCKRYLRLMIPSPGTSPVVGFNAYKPAHLAGYI
jgi:hypothetical protein